MQDTDVVTIAREIITLYGYVQPWREATNVKGPEVDRLSKHFAGYLPAKVLDAVKSHAYEHPDKAPKPAELLARIRAQTKAPEGLADPERCPHPPPWALVDERTNHDSEDQPPISPLTMEHPVGTRVALCTRCHTEFIRKPKAFLTEGEIEERDRQRQEARHG